MPDKNHYARCLFSMPDASKLCQIWHTLCQVETTGFCRKNPGSENSCKQKLNRFGLEMPESDLVQQLWSEQWQEISHGKNILPPPRVAYR